MAMHFDITDFRLFINIAETSSLTRGAERSFLSVPATSNRIKNLEDNLGMRLLERSPQGVTLTNAGKTYLQHARIILSQLEMLTGDLQQYAEASRASCACWPTPRPLPNTCRQWWANTSRPTPTCTSICASA